MHALPARQVWSAVGLLTLAYVLSYVDRTIILLLVGPIKADLHISDTQFSLLHGFAFAILYTLMGVPIGWLADRANRRHIIGAGILIWSLMTALCGLARTFPQLFAARVGVGVGEAALSPAAYSLIADLAPKHALGRALAIYGSAVFLGIGLSFLGGGWLVDQLLQNGSVSVPLVGQLQPWQQVLLLVGLPGIALGAIILWSLPEIRTAGLGTEPSATTYGPSLLAHIRENRTFLFRHFTGFSMVSLLFNGYLAWLTEYFLRVHGWSKSLAGFALGAIILIFGTCGMLLSGVVTDRFARRCASTAAMRAGLLGAVALLPWPIWATSVDAPWLSLIGIAPIVFFCSFCFGPAVIALQVVTPPPLRARISALYLFVVNFAGIGLGGTAMAFLSDSVFRNELRIGDSMAAVGTVAAILAVVFLWPATRPRTVGAIAADT